MPLVCQYYCEDVNILFDSTLYYTETVTFVHYFGNFFCFTFGCVSSAPCYARNTKLQIDLLRLFLIFSVIYTK